MKEKLIIKNISKEFKIGFKKHQGILGKTISFISGREPKRKFLALDNISFSVKPKEIVGIIGPNSVGKSTLLRIIGKIYQPSNGKIITNQKIILLLKENIGLDIRLDMKESIFLSCALLGLKKEQTRKIFKKIVEFSELEKYINTKLYQFSTGMILRLFFSIIINSLENKGSEILLLDEIFTVSDKKFKEKCIKKIKEIAENGSSIILVSHDLKLIEKECTKIIWLDKGKIVKEGGKEIVKEYTKSQI